MFKKTWCSAIIVLACLTSINEAKSLVCKGPATTPAANVDSCQMSTKYKMMSSKTSYVLVADEDAKKEFQMPKCKQVGLWHLSRHGQRFPEDKDIDEINKNLLKFRNRILNESTSTYLCEQDKQELKAWTPKMNTDDGYYLTPDGIKFMKKLGSRMKNRLDDLMDKLRSTPEKVNVKATNITRTIQSSKAYLDGLFGETTSRPNLTIQQDTSDFLLKFPDLCEKYIEEIDENSSACQDSSKFESSSAEYIEELNKFEKRFGLSLSASEKKKLFDIGLKACQYEYLVDGTDSIWCKYFPKNLLRLIEYREDLKYYCKYGYKYNISRDMTCDLMSDLVSSLRDLKSKNPKTLASLYFTHSSTMLPFIASMGLYHKDTDFDFQDVKNINENRTYRTSRIDPMNSNVAFVVFKCSEDSTYKLRVFHNENQVQPGGCTSKTDCDLDEFVAFHENFIKRCGSSQSVCTICQETNE